MVSQRLRENDLAEKEARRQAERDRQDYRQLKWWFDFLTKVDPLADGYYDPAHKRASTMFGSPSADRDTKLAQCPQ